MRSVKLLLIALFLITLVSANSDAEVLKPFAPPIDIYGEQLENNENTNIQKEGVIKKVHSAKSSKIKSKDDKKEVKKDEKITTLEEKGEVSLDKRYDEQLKTIESYNNIPESKVTEVTEKKEDKQEVTPEKTQDTVVETTQLPENKQVEDPPEENTLAFEADLSQPKVLSDIQKEAESISTEMRIEEASELQALRVLWTAAVENNTTIRLAIQKLSNPDEGAEGQSAMSKVFSPLAGVASVAAMTASSSTQAAGALLGGGLFGTLASDRDHSYNQAFIKVSDYNLIMLAKEVDELQKDLVFCYYEYKQALDRLVESENAKKKAESYYNKVQGSNDFGAITAADAFYREAKQHHLKAKQEFFNARSDLEQITGNDAIVYIETMGSQPAAPEAQPKETSAK